MFLAVQEPAQIALSVSVAISVASQGPSSSTRHCPEPERWAWASLSWVLMWVGREGVMSWGASAEGPGSTSQVLVQMVILVQTFTPVGWI